MCAFLLDYVSHLYMYGIHIHVCIHNIQIIELMNSHYQVNEKRGPVSQDGGWEWWEV